LSDGPDKIRAFLQEFKERYPLEYAASMERLERQLLEILAPLRRVP